MTTRQFLGCAALLLCTATLPLSAAGADVADAAMRADVATVRALIAKKADVNAAQPGTLIFANDQEVTSYGFELSGAFQPAAWWRMRGGYTFLEKDFRLLSANALAFSEPFEAQDPQNQMLLQSIMDLPHGIEFDVVARRVAELPATALNPRIPEYTTADVRLAWRISRWELSAIGQNLGGSHSEFASPVLPFEIPRSFHGRVSFSW